MRAEGRANAVGAAQTGRGRLLVVVGILAAVIATDASRADARGGKPGTVAVPTAQPVTTAAAKATKPGKTRAAKPSRKPAGRS
jgi:hypothetical protein